MTGPAGDALPPLPRLLWDDLPVHAAETFTEPFGVILTLGAVTGTATLSASDGDHAARVFVQENFASKAYGDAAVVAGYVMPVLTPVALLGLAQATQQPEWTVHGASAAQAVVLTFGATVVLKVATGRPFPRHGADPHAPDRLEHPEWAREWHPFAPGKALSNGYLAWPSGHASAAFAAAAALSSSTADPLVTIIGYGVASGIATGMIVGDHHWTSDVLAGALLGQAVGDVVGRGYRARYLAGERGFSRLSLIPSWDRGPFLTASVRLE
jgi:membrane-associated phospholipid phosphatase